MKAFMLLTVLFSQMAFADTYSYQLFYDDMKTEELDIKIDVVLTGKFKSSSKVSAVKIYGIEKNKNVLLFNIPGKDLTAKWLPGNVLDITSNSVNSVVKKKFYPYHSDTQIDSKSDYSISDMTFNEAGTLQGDYGGFDMSNDSFEEMALAGFMKKIK